MPGLAVHQNLATDPYSQYDFKLEVTSSCILQDAPSSIHVNIDLQSEYEHAQKS